jgi:hypothetical protein
VVLGFVIVRVSVAVVLICVDDTLKALVIVGGGTTMMEAEAVNPVPSLVELTAPVVLVDVPAVVEVIVAVTVQLPLGAIDPPVSLMDVVVEVATEPLVHVVATPV